MSEFRPRIALTMGDVAGIGPEILGQIISDREIQDLCQPIVIGSPEHLRQELQRQGRDAEVQELSTVTDATFSENGIACWNPATVDCSKVPIGQIDGRAGQAAFDWLVAAIELAQHNQIDAIVTAPLNKAALHAAGLDYPGHTEILGEKCGVPEFAMMLYLPPGKIVQGPSSCLRPAGPFGLGVAHVTLHTSIASVPGLLTTEEVFSKIELVDGFLKQLGCTSPRVGVCALNPHGGEGGLFGDEESRIIEPAVERAQDRGVDARGPFPTDTLMYRAVQGEFDGIVAMYHDQGHIALKLIGFQQAVNVTLGLPIIRTSPSHGTGFDIVGQGKADATGMREAIKVAVKLAQHRQEQTE